MPSPASDADAPPRDAGHDVWRKALGEGGVIVVEARGPPEFAGGRIPGAVDLPLFCFQPNQIPAVKASALIYQTRAHSGAVHVRHYPGGYGAVLSDSDATPAASATPDCTSTESGWRVNERSKPPTNALAPTPAPTATDASAPT